MKRWLIVGLVFLTLFLVACGSPEPEPEVVEPVVQTPGIVEIVIEPGEVEAELFMQYYNSLVTRDQNKINKRAGLDPTVPIAGRGEQFRELYNTLSPEGQEILKDVLKMDNKPYDPSQVDLAELIHFFEFDMWQYWGVISQ